MHTGRRAHSAAGGRLAGGAPRVDGNIRRRRAMWEPPGGRFLLRFTTASATRTTAVAATLTPWECTVYGVAWGPILSVDRGARISYVTVPKIPRTKALGGARERGGGRGRRRR